MSIQLEYFDLVKSIEYFLLKNISCFKLRIFNIVSVCLYLAHASLRNFCNTMPRHEPFGVIRQPSSSGSGADDGLEFIHCVGGECHNFTNSGVSPRTELLAKFVSVQLCAASVTIAFGRTVWRRLRISCTPITSVVMSGLIGLMMTGNILDKLADQ